MSLPVWLSESLSLITELLNAIYKGTIINALPIFGTLISFFIIYVLFTFVKNRRN